MNNLGQAIEVTYGYYQLSHITDIRTQQDELMNRFGELTMSESDEISIDSFHLMKASNSPLIVSERIISWVKKHEVIYPLVEVTVLRRKRNSQTI